MRLLVLLLLLMLVVVMVVVVVVVGVFLQPEQGHRGARRPDALRPAARLRRAVIAWRARRPRRGQPRSRPAQVQVLHAPVAEFL